MYTMGGFSPRSMSLMWDIGSLRDALLILAFAFLVVTVLLGFDSLHTFFKIREFGARIARLEADAETARVSEVEKLQRRVAELERDRA